MSRVSAARTAECLLASAFQIKVAEIVLIQESAPAVILAETAFLPVDLILKAASQRSFGLPVFSQRSWINLDLPSGAAGVRAFCGDTSEFFIIMGYCILHGQITPFIQNTI